MFAFTKPFDINWDLNNICNLMCPQCGRNEIVDGVLQKRTDNIPGGETLDDRDNSLETFKKVFGNIEHSVRTVRFQGHLSENVASRDFLPICDFIIEQGTRVHVSTNGSLRPSSWWFKLGQVFSKNRDSHINFCLDGMGPELSIYRVGANYDKIIENAKAFIDGGGNARWVMIVFKHNQHQIEDAKRESKRLGFNDFRITHTNRRYNMDISYEYKGEKYILENQDIFSEWNERVDHHLKYRETDELQDISCKAVKENQFYISYKNRPWACYYIPEMEFLADEQKWYKDYYNDESNTLENKTLYEIFNNVFYDILPMSWGEKGSCLSLCKKNCSVKNGLVRGFDFVSGKVLKDQSGGDIQSHVEL